ncbi:hypothetical protein MC885_014306 [Smutsia gigantea]|nr:hypothetical protein MC885_014306 [Smutsia gigantea]
MGQDALFLSLTRPGFLYPKLWYSTGGRGLCRHRLLGRGHPLERDQVPDADGRAEAEGVPGVLDHMVSSARQEGLGVFFQGLTINSARTFPVNSVTFLSYEYLLRSWG